MSLQMQVPLPVVLLPACSAALPIVHAFVSLRPKARVAPLCQTTIPRPELMAALIGTRLAKTVHCELLEKPHLHLWTESCIVLHWIQPESIDPKPFMGVRVADIQSTWLTTVWNHVPTLQTI